jgi:hypothetical protein
MAFDPVETKKKADAEIKEMEAAQRQMENTLAGHQLAVKEIGKQAAQDKQKQRDEQKAKDEQAAQDAIQRDIDRLKTEEDTLANRRAIAEKEFELRKKDLQKKGYDETLMAKMLADELLKIDQEFYKQQETIRKAAEEKRKQENAKAATDELAFIQKKYDEEELAAMKAAKTQEDLQKALSAIRLRELQNLIQSTRDAGNSTIELEKEIEQIRLENAKTAAEKQKEIDDKTEEERKKKAEAKQRDIEMAFRASEAMLGLFDALTTNSNAKSEEERKREFERKKKFELASAMISTAAAAQQAYQSQMATAAVGDVTAPIRAAVAAATAIASGLARVAMISKQQYQSPSMSIGGGGMSASRGNIPMPSMNSSSLGGGTQQAGQWSNKVYVTEGDISATQRRTRNLRKTSVL